MQNSFSQIIKKRALFNHEDKLLLAISGGVDSMVLWHLIDQLGYSYAVAHCNFQLRGEDSDGDETFVKKLASTKGVVCYSKSFDTELYARTHKVSTQMAARELRYQWFDELRIQHHYSKVLIAQHADDDIETYLLNLIRGTSLKGLKGISESTGNLIRPMLEFSRIEIIEYANEHNVTWREDASNMETYYKRNFLRHKVIPELKELNPDFLNTMKRNMAKNAEVFEVTERHVNSLRDTLLELSGDGVVINKQSLKNEKVGPFVLSELLKDYGINLTQAQEILESLDSESGKVFTTNTHKLNVDRISLFIKPKVNGVQGEILIEENDRYISIPKEYAIQLKPVDGLEIDRSSENGMFDYDKLEFPLILRNWKQGDKFIPLGMKGNKLISDLLIDLKLSVLDKESVCVLCSGKRIIWVVGLRLSDESKITKSTKRVLHFFRSV